ncbi:HMG-box [Coemansia reversa NRRL 1564]|uniref:HMG-box n=1 Tax=Coemansia reversa (strain ATCC 12441 / NRRL 1564) TaxID=763665 RepID=A0A2G5BA58_COERN|nr:HMG-box [Coemansia reversa NRRL 1564]|eukprot:PIA15862.1 HMG-box [Coemansia reversa NRRL 1564]
MSRSVHSEEEPVLTRKDLCELAELHSKLAEAYARISGGQPVTKVRKVQRKPAADPDRPKHPLGAFLLFSRVERASIAEKNPGASPRQVAIMLGEHWRGLDAKDRQQYVDKANINREKYVAELAQYEANKKEKGGEDVPADADDSSDEQSRSKTSLVELASQEQQASKSAKIAATAGGGVGTSGDSVNEDDAAKKSKKKHRKHKSKDRADGSDETSKKKKSKSK